MFQGFATRNYKATRHDYQDVHYKSATKHICIFVAAAAVENPISCINVEKKSETFFLVHDTFITSFGTSLKLGKPH